MTKSSQLFLAAVCMAVIISSAYAYDVLDPTSNITIAWDLMRQYETTQDVKVSISNYQLYRQINYPGWKLSWKWEHEEVIWDVRGAEATEQGDCSRYNGSQLPHSCEETPTIVDLMPWVAPSQKVANCCTGGVLSSILQDPDNTMAAFEMTIDSVKRPPEMFNLDIQGYTCSRPKRVSSTRFTTDHGRRYTQALGTWHITCKYSIFLASPAPTCCVSLSAFYSETIVPCSGKICEPRGHAPKCFLKPTSSDNQPEPILRCTLHMCPIRVHWHVQINYKKYWRVKITISNYYIGLNYSNWNLVVTHPNLESVTEVSGFNYKPIIQYGDINDSGVFYGIKFYNDILLDSRGNGNMQIEVLMEKGVSFTFNDGWAFPRRIIFNGDECIMPSPDKYPMLPNTSPHWTSYYIFSLILLLVILVFLAYLFIYPFFRFH